MSRRSDRLDPFARLSVQNGPHTVSENVLDKMCPILAEVAPDDVRRPMFDAPPDLYDEVDFPDACAPVTVLMPSNTFFFKIFI